MIAFRHNKVRFYIIVFLLPLSQMSREEKLKAMEALWIDLTREEEFESPAWHGDALRETEKAIEAGEAGFVEWEQAKKRLHDRNQ